MSRIELNIRVFKGEDNSPLSNTEINRSYNVEVEDLQRFIDSAIVSLLAGDPVSEIITVVPCNNDNEIKD